VKDRRFGNQERIIFNLKWR